PRVAGQVEQREEHDDRRDEREHHHGGADPARDRLADALAEEEQQDRAEQRQRGHDPDQVEEVARAHLPTSSIAESLRRSRSSAVAPRRRRKMATMMPRPTATSAAATASTKNTMTWPRMSFSWLANDTNVRFTALSMSSTHMNITSTLRRVSRPTAPMVNN